MTGTVVINIVDNGYLVQYTNDAGQTEKKVYSFGDMKQILVLVESWMEVDDGDRRVQDEAI